MGEVTLTGTVEHAMAVLVGKPAGVFSLPPLPLTAQPPSIPLAMPSELLERRPDIASAERHMASANAQIGVARAAYYPTIKLGISAGLEASDITKLLSWPSRFWSMGPTVSQTMFDGGLRKAQNAQVLALFDGTEASYRQTVLGAFKEVEDNVAVLRILAEEAQIQNDAVEAARQTVQSTINQYQAGIVGYPNVISAQTLELTSKITAIQILGRRMIAAVQLMKALGGGWSQEKISRY